MSNLELLLIIVVAALVFMSWQLDRILKAIKQTGYDADATGYLGDIFDEVEAIRQHIAPKTPKK